MKKLIGSRKERVDALSFEYLTHKALADNALARLKKELESETECETDAFTIRYKPVARRTFDKSLFIARYGQMAYDKCLVDSESRRFNLTRKKKA